MSAISNRIATGPPRTRAKRRVLLIAVLACGVVLAAVIFALLHPIHDFVEYWTAAHLLISGHNPYSLAEVFRMERALGFEQSVPIMLLSPPWSLAFLAALGLAKSYAIGWIFWIATLVAAVAWSSRMIMDVYFGELRIPEISDTAFYRCLFAFTFYPVLLCLRYAQTAPLMLLGIAGFLYFERKERDILAGAFLSLTLIKPQLLFLVWLAVMLKSARERRWKLLTSAAGCIALLSGTVLLVDPHAFQQYRALAATPYFQAYASGVTAGIRKFFGGVGTFWMQLVPPVVGLAWFVVYSWRHRKTWSWTENLPMLVTISVVTSAYGWLFDQTLLVLPIIALAARRAHTFGRLPARLVSLYTALNFGLMAVMPFPTLNLLPAPLCIALLLLRDSKCSEMAANSPQLEVCAK